jgi:hypothetical protein
MIGKSDEKYSSKIKYFNFKRTRGKIYLNNME